jgi:protein-tyrosine kinase
MERLEAALAKAREMRQTTIRTGADLPSGAAARPEQTSAWSTLTEFTLDPERAQRYRISALSGGKDAGPYDILRGRALRQMKEKGWRRLAITSPDAGCGKTTIAMNLAFSMARQKDLRVMLVDLDLRRPAVHKALGQSVKSSFWEVLGRTAAFEDCAMRYDSNLIVAMNNQPALQPAELLQSAQTIAVLQEIEARWRPDVVIFDLSPLLAGDDNLGFLGNCDSALLIAASESTTMNNIDTSEKELASLTHVMGVVLNKCRYVDESVGYSYSSY